MKKFSLLAAVLLFAATAKSNTYTVTNVNDAGLGSLRAAIDSANNNPGQDSIVFTLSFPIINLASPLQTITDSLIIQGMTCQAPTISGAFFTNSVALFSTSDPSIPLTLNYLFISNAYNQSFGAQGGAVDAGPVFINYCAFVACTAEDNSGFGFGSDGGAIVAENLVANNSTFIDNIAFTDGEAPASLGGAVAVYTNGNFSNCTFVDNTVDDFGSAIYINNGNINNCTLDSNAVTGDEGSGAIFGDDPNVVVIANSIVWGSTAASGFYPGIYFFSPVNSGGCNILEQQADNYDFTYAGSDTTGADPLLFGSVHMYGGCVPTLPIQCGSPAIHHATCTGFTTSDARDVVALTARDAGAYQTNSPTASTGPNVTQCGGTAIFNAANAIAGESYQWSDGDTTQNDTVSTSGTYTVTITNTPAYTIGGQTGCSVVSSFSAYLKPAPAVNLGNDTFQCGGSVTLNAGNAGDNYLWGDNETTQFITVTASGLYSVVVTDTNSGCTGSGAINVTIDNPPVVNLGTDITQCGGSVNLDAGNAGDGFLWSDASSNETLVVFASGYYTVTVTDAGNCSSTGGVNVSINPVPSVYLPADTTACGSEMVLDAGGSGDGYSYFWFDETSNEWDTATSSGTYWVTVTNSFDCTASAQSNVTLNPAPIVNLGPDVNQCGGMVTLDAGNAGDIYVWSDGSTNETLTASTSGTYSVTVANGSNCSASASINIYIQPAPQVNLGNNISQCGGSVTLNAGNAGDDYLWSDNETTQFITVTTSNTYSVTVTDPNSGCTAVGSINVFIDNPPVVNLGTDIVQCGGSVTLDAGNAGDGFAWSDGSSNETLFVSSSGYYAVTVTDGSNCSGTGGVNVSINPVPVVYLPADTTACGSEMVLDAGGAGDGFSYFWFDETSNEWDTVTLSGTYGVTVTNSFDCTASAQSNVTLNPEPVVNLGGRTTQCGGTVTLNAMNPGDQYFWSDDSTAQTITVSTTGLYSVTVTNDFNCSASDSVNVYIQPAPEVNLGNNISQCGGSVTLNAGNAGDNYLWSDNETTQFITVTTSNTYSVTVTDPNSGCTAAGSVNVFIDNPPVVNLGTDITQCGGSVTLDAGNAGDGFAWSDGSSNETLVVFASGYYTVTVTDAGNCSSTGGVNVSINPVPAVYLPADTTACGSEMVLDAGPGNDYFWFDESNNEWDTVSQSGTYGVTVTNSFDCSASAQSNVTLNPEPAVNLGGGITQCGGTVTLDAVNPGDSYFWSDGSTNETLTVATSGLYSVTVTNGFNCSASGSTNVYIEPTPYVNLGNDTTQCGGTITLNAWNPGDLYNWSDGESTQIITVSTSNSYNVTVTDPNSGCTATSGLSVQINPVPVIDLGPDISQCGGSVVLDAGNAGSSFAWSQGSTTETITATTSGQYSVTVTNDFNCSASDSINIYINLVPTVYLGQDITQCGGSVTLDAGNPGFIYDWSTNATTQTIQVSVSGTYDVTVTSPIDGCTASDSIEVTIDTVPVVDLGPDTTQCGGPVILYADNAGATYLWSDNSTADSLAVTVSGIYRVTVTNSNGCSAVGSVMVTINPIPVVTLSLPANVCDYVPPFPLTGGLPAGGTYFEADTAISIFNANQQGIGPHKFTYVYSNIYGCSDSDSATIFVRPQPIVTTLNPPVLCVTSPAIDLNNYFTPAGGMYFGNGVSQDLFYPKLAVPGIDTVLDIYTDNFGCMDTESYFIPVNPDVHTDLTSSVADFTICQGQSITLTATGADFYQFFVNGMAQADSVPADSTFTTTTLTDHSIIYVVGSNACSTDTSEPVVIDVITPPVVSAGPDTTIALGQSVELHGVATGDGNLTYLWTPGDGLNYINIPNPIYSGTDTISFWFKAEDSYGCADSAQVTVNVYVPDNVLLPTVITPNGDGYNDLWVLNPKINLDGSHLVIFDRWGEVVYETENYANNWGGTYKSTGKLLPDDTYYFVLTVPAQNNHTYEGPINIISGKQ